MPSLDDINLRQFYIYDSNQNDTLNTAMTFLANNTFSTYSNLIQSSGVFNIEARLNSGAAIVGFSFISTKKYSDIGVSNINYRQNGPFNVFELNTQLSNRYNKLLSALSILQRCDRITKYIVKDQASVTKNLDGYYYTSAQPNPTPSGYIHFGYDPSGCSAFHADNLFSYTTGVTPTNITGNIFDTRMYDSTKPSTDKPQVTVADSNLGLIKYPKFASQHSEFDNKNIGQMVGDIQNLMQNYQKIVQYFQSTPLDASGNPPNGDDDHAMSNLRQIYQSNLKVRQELDQKIQAVLGAKQSYTYESKMHLDSSIYANIMLSILATTLIYFVLVKL